MSSRPNFSPGRELDTWAGAIELISRKIAHLAEYAVLMALVLVSVRKTWPGFSRWHFLSSFLLVIIYAMTDEWHQTFVFGRTGTVRDVFIDSLGALIGFYYDLRNEKKERVPPQSSTLLESEAYHQN